MSDDIQFSDGEILTGEDARRLVADHNPPPREWRVGEMVNIEPYQSFDEVEEHNDNIICEQFERDEPRLIHELCPGILNEDMVGASIGEIFATVGEHFGDNGSRWYTYKVDGKEYFEWMLQSINELDALESNLYRVIGNITNLQVGSSWLISTYTDRSELVSSLPRDIGCADGHRNIRINNDDYPDSFIDDMYSSEAITAILRKDSNDRWYFRTHTWTYYPWMLKSARRVGDTRLGVDMADTGKDVWSYAKGHFDKKMFFGFGGENIVDEDISGWILLGPMVKSDSFNRRALGLLSKKPDKIPEGHKLVKILPTGKWEVEK